MRSSSTAMSLRGTVEETSIRVEGDTLGAKNKLSLKHHGSRSSFRGGERQHRSVDWEIAAWWER